jgi:hypothetical protein
MEDVAGAARAEDLPCRNSKPLAKPTSSRKALTENIQ